MDFHIDDVIHDFKSHTAFEQLLQRDHLVKDTAERPYVRSIIDARLLVDHLGTHVLKRSSESTDRIKITRKTQVPQLDAFQFVQEYIPNAK